MNIWNIVILALSVTFSLFDLFCGYFWYSRRHTDKSLNNPFNWFFLFSLLLSPILSLSSDNFKNNLWILFLSTFLSYIFGILFRIVQEKWQIFKLAKAIKNVDSKIKKINDQIDELRSEVLDYSLKMAITKCIDEYKKDSKYQIDINTLATATIKISLLNGCFIERDELKNNYDRVIKNEIKKLKTDRTGKKDYREGKHAK